MEENLLQVDEDKRLDCVRLLEQVPNYREIVSHFQSTGGVTRSEVVNTSSHHHKVMADHVNKVATRKEEVVVSHSAPRREEYVKSTAYNVTSAPTVVRDQVRMSHQTPTVVRNEPKVDVRYSQRSGLNTTNYGATVVRRE